MSKEISEVRLDIESKPESDEEDDEDEESEYDENDIIDFDQLVDYNQIQKNDKEGYIINEMNSSSNIQAITPNSQIDNLGVNEMYIKNNLRNKNKDMKVKIEINNNLSDNLKSDRKGGVSKLSSIPSSNPLRNLLISTDRTSNKYRDMSKSGAESRTILTKVKL